ncbi:MAG: hypothetical protein QOC78_734 [Solirubrobacteraceae bacterium]|jgi:deoxyadenosine/deoxycytidine kinase|nr:hypothetical protein [Solirubrobacteraceae bacterium]
MVIALEGLPGVGKTTTAGLLADRLAAKAVLETTADHPFLHQVYDDDDRDDLTVELTFLIVHANPYRRLDRSALTVCDFSPAKDELFAQDMLAGEDLRLFEEVYARTYRAHPLPNVAVYLRADPGLCLERVQERMRREPTRSFEAGMTLERLRRMEERYDDALQRLGQQSLVCHVERHMTADAVVRAVAELLRQRVPMIATL